ncbi:Wzz/FepE/Etk N-terminal domain-containing protein [Enterovibrio norvegicus]|uniref:Lipopolysaccharide biosynthesis protein n=1 Tax=Enterovibrio norvegicus TaxID=188144 RepID=A0A2N7LDZ8_9GAMM|nr:Wzz/FepE/Etk N-terminal domain-containing protein [Enterovibrio norvegicus]PML75578.1 lipopolysaccharide biosynthesis protein [Enterovibrio norvegicus]PMN93500.1 lipopolysaccharide biosynthesis protein [Enterovibrio norvegicus]
MENNHLSAKYPTDAHFQPQAPASDEIDLRELFSALWKGKWIIIVTTFLFTVAGVFYALSLPNIYKADALLAPAESSGGGLSKMAAQFGGLASLAGVSLGGGEASQTDLAAEVIKSRQFVNAFIAKHELMVPLMAAKGWDLSKNELIFDEEIYNAETKTWLREPKGLRGSEPSKQEMYEAFVKQVLTVGSDKKSGFYTLSIEHYSPYLAKQWTDWLIADINKVMRERTIKETTQNLVYLENQLEKTAIADMQSTFYSLIEEQTKSLMLAEVQDEFVFKVIDRPVVPEMKAEPKRALICVLATLLGGMIGMGVVLVRLAFKQKA